jgi:hypothetical protein
MNENRGLKIEDRGWKDRGSRMENRKWKILNPETGTLNPEP